MVGGEDSVSEEDEVDPGPFLMMVNVREIFFVSDRVILASVILVVGRRD